jgi:hypothetical protein
VRLAFRFAIESEHITTDGIEVSRYPDLIERYRISSVPKIVIGDTVEFVGGGPEAVLLKHVREAAGHPRTAP